MCINSKELVQKQSKYQQSLIIRYCKCSLYGFHSFFKVLHNPIKQYIDVSQRDNIITYYNGFFKMTLQVKNTEQRPYDFRTATRRQRPKKLLQINRSKDNSSYIINRMNLIQFQKLKTWVLCQFEVALVAAWNAAVVSRRENL